MLNKKVYICKGECGTRLNDAEYKKNLTKKCQSINCSHFNKQLTESIKETEKLIDKKCIPCEQGTKPLEEIVIKHYLKGLQNKWDVIEHKKLQYKFEFKNFKQAIYFVNKISDLVESEGHHPDIHIFYNKVIIELWTHAIKGLSENDFIIAAKIEKIS